MGSCGAKNIQKNPNLTQPILKNKQPNENQFASVPPKSNPPQVSVPLAEMKTPQKKQQQLPYFIPIISVNLKDQLRRVLQDVTAKVVVDELIKGKPITEITGEQIGKIDRFNDLVAINKELLTLLYYLDADKVKQLPQVDNFLSELTKMKYTESHSQFVEFIDMMQKNPTYRNIGKAIQLEKKSIYLLIETFAAFQVVRNDCYSNETKHWWRPIEKQQSPLKEIQFEQQMQQKKNELMITNDYFDYYFDKFTGMITEYFECINSEKEQQRRMQEDEKERKRIEEEQAYQERLNKKMYEEVQARRTQQEKDNNQLFEEDEQQVNCRGVGNINNFQFHVKKQLIV